MKINVDQILKTFAGVEMKDDSDAALTLRWVCNAALLGHNPKDETSAEEKMTRYRLAFRVDKGGEIELDSDEISKIKKLIAASMGTLVYGQCADMLERKGPDGKPLTE